MVPPEPADFLLPGACSKPKLRLRYEVRSVLPATQALYETAIANLLERELRRVCRKIAKLAAQLNRVEEVLDDVGPAEEALDEDPAA